MPDIVLHHYDLSPYAEKVRIALGIKRAAWRACVPPVVAPKPDLVALTGGYRRVPVMQIGADIFCDSDCIIRALDQLVPRPSLLAGGIGAMGFALAPWFTALMVEDAVPVAFRDAESVDPAFARDREELMGRPFVDLPAWKAAAPHAMEALQAQLGWIEQCLSDGRDWLEGDAPGMLDIFAYPVLGFLRWSQSDCSMLDTRPLFLAWEKRVVALSAKSAETITAQEAVEIAQANSPRFEWAAGPAPEPNGLYIGDAVRAVCIDGSGEPLEGAIASLSDQHVTILRDDPRAGQVAVHFPRYGFRLERV